MYAVKELSRDMSNPDSEDWNDVKRLGRHLHHHPRILQMFRKQHGIRNIYVWVDTDFAGCMKTRKSTSGGIVMFGESEIKGMEQHSEMYRIVIGRG